MLSLNLRHRNKSHVWMFIHFYMMPGGRVLNGERLNVLELLTLEMMTIRCAFPALFSFF